MSHRLPQEISPSDHLLAVIKELNDICLTLKDRAINAFEEDEAASTGLKLLAEYRHLLKLRFDILKKARTLIKEACFQKAVLNALREADEVVYKKAISALWELEKEWDGENEDAQLPIDEGARALDDTRES